MISLAILDDFKCRTKGQQACILKHKSNDQIVQKFCFFWSVIAQKHIRFAWFFLNLKLVERIFRLTQATCIRNSMYGLNQKDPFGFTAQRIWDCGDKLCYKEAGWVDITRECALISWVVEVFNMWTLRGCVDLAC